MEARQDEPVATAIDDGEREALVAARLLERVVPDDPDPAERLPDVPFEDRCPGLDLVDIGDDLPDPVEVGRQDGLEARVVTPAGEPLEAPAE